MRSTFLSYSILLLCFAWIPSTTSAEEESSSQSATYRTMSFNLRYGTANDGDNRWPNRKELVAKTIKRFDPDLLGMQDGRRMLNLPTQADKLQILIDYASSRKSKMSCLECWSKDTVPLEVDMSEIEQLTAERASLVMEYATPRQKQVLAQGLDGNTEIQRQAYLLEVEEQSPFFVGNKHEKFFKKIDEALKRAETHQRFRDFKHKCGGGLLLINDGAIRANIPPRQFVLDLEGYLIEERQPPERREV